MHNSLYIRDLLSKTNNDPIRLARHDPHRTVVRDPWALPPEGAIEMSGLLRVSSSISPDVDALIEHDLTDFLNRIEVRTISTPAEQGHNIAEVRVRIGIGLGPGDCRLTVESGTVTIEGGDTAGVWAAVTWLEWELRVARGPFLRLGRRERQAAWPYTTVQWEHPDRVEFVRHLPERVAYFMAVEKDTRFDKGPYVKHIWDYSVDCTGPSEVVRETVPLAAAEGHPVFIKTETGIGLEVFQFPYVPAMQHLASKWQVVRDLHPTGVQQSWLFYGMFGSRAEELALWARYTDISADEFLHHIAVRDFGPNAAGSVEAAWECMSRAVQHLPVVTLSTYYVGPSFLGPAYPLVPREGDVIPDVFYGYLYYLLETNETFSHRQFDETRTRLVMTKLPDARSLGIDWSGDHDGWDIIIGEYAVAALEARNAFEHLARLEGDHGSYTPADRMQLREETLLTELVYRTFLSCENVCRFLKARHILEGSGLGDIGALD